MVKNTMTPTTKTDVTFEHIGAARLYNGSVRIDVKTMLAVIPANEICRLEQNWPAPVYDISDVMKNSDAAPVGKAWITRSGKAVMILINGVQFVSPLAQVKGMLSGERKYANVSSICPVQSKTVTSPSGVTA
jgi:pyruvate/2-oxoglutarate/acetoin dehydrogenase E1 component